MDIEESHLAALVVAGSDSSLAVQALEEANELLGLENARLRNNNRVLRTVVRALRSKSTELFNQVDELQQHIFAVAAQEDELEVVDIHPFDFGQLLLDAPDGAEVFMRGDGLVEYQDKLYRQTVDVPYTPTEFSSKAQAVMDARKSAKNLDSDDSAI
jgi:ABC-type transporter Mla subunit MlaD